MTETGLSMGTPHYMNPEQATGDLSVGAPTDIYALGGLSAFWYPGVGEGLGQALGQASPWNGAPRSPRLGEHSRALERPQALDRAE